jgi:hypothetical protein
MCCDFHIGEDNGTETRQCNNACETVILGDLKPEDKVKELPKTDLKESRKLKKDVLERKSRDPHKHPFTHKKKKLSSRRKKVRSTTPKIEKNQQEDTPPQNKQQGVTPNQNKQVNPNAAAKANEKMKNFFQSD